MPTNLQVKELQKNHAACDSMHHMWAMMSLHSCTPHGPITSGLTDHYADLKIANLNITCWVPCLSSQINRFDQRLWVSKALHSIDMQVYTESNGFTGARELYTFNDM